MDDFVARRRLEEGGIPQFDDVCPEEEGFGDFMDDLAGNNFNNMGNTYEDDSGLKLTARHLFCFAADALILPKATSYPSSSTTSSIQSPSIHCDINTFETRGSLINLWSSARSQMPKDIILKTVRLVSEHKETLRGNEVYLWYPQNDAGTEGMLRVLN